MWGDEREKGAGGATEASSRTVEHATSSGMHNPNMAPSPFAHETMEMVAVNVNGGVYIEERPNTRGGAAEAGTAMMYEPTARMLDLVQKMKEGGRTGVTIWADTHLDEEMLVRVQGYLRKMYGIESYGTPGEYEAESGEAARAVRRGVLVMWYPSKVEMTETHTVVEGRIVRMRAKVQRDGREFILYGCYMPTRTCEGVRECWKELEDDIIANATGEVAVGGDLNAETPGWLRASGKTDASKWTPGDVAFHELLEACELRSCVKQATYRAGTSIDHWLVTQRLGACLGKGTTRPGVANVRDHEAVVVTYVFRDEGPDEGRVDRPMERVWAKMKKEARKVYPEEAYEAWMERRAEMRKGGVMPRADEELLALQEILTATAAKLGGRRGGDGEGGERGERNREAKSGPKLSERQYLWRKVGYWRELREEAMEWGGGAWGRWKKPWLMRRLEREGVDLPEAELEPRERRKQVVRAVDEKVREAEEKHRDSEPERADRILKRMEEAAVWKKRR